MKYSIITAALLFKVDTRDCFLAYMSAINRFVFENVVNKKQNKNKLKIKR